MPGAAFDVALDMNGHEVVDAADPTTAQSLVTRAYADAHYTAGAGTELDYVQVTAPLTVTPTTDATAATFITGSSVAYNGTTVVLLEVWAPYADITSGQAVLLNLYDGSTDLGRIANVQTISATGAAGTLSVTVHGMRRFTPANATHQYLIKAWKTGGTAHVGAGAGGTAAYMPAFLRITRA